MIEGMVKKIVLGIIGIVVVFSLVASLYPTLEASGDNISATSMPFASFFASGGILFTLFGIGIFLTAMGLIFGISKLRGK